MRWHFHRQKEGPTTTNTNAIYSLCKGRAFNRMQSAFEEQQIIIYNPHELDGATSWVVLAEFALRFG